MRIGFAQRNQVEASHYQISVGIVHKKGFDATPILVSELHSLEEVELTKWKSLELKDGTSFTFVMMPTKDGNFKIKGTIKNKMAGAHKPVEFIIQKHTDVEKTYDFVDNQSVEITMKLERQL